MNPGTELLWCLEKKINIMIISFKQKKNIIMQSSMYIYRKFQSGQYKEKKISSWEAKNLLQGFKLTNNNKKNSKYFLSSELRAKAD